MKVSARTLLAKRWLARAIVSGMVLSLPACHIPALRHAEAAPELPASYSLASSISAKPAPKPSTTPPGGPTAPMENLSPGGGTIAPASAVIEGATLIPMASAAPLDVESFFNDPRLISLIHLAVSGNRELKRLDQEVQIASNEVLSRRGAYLPTVSVGGGGGTEKTSRFTRNGAVEEQLEIPPGRRFPDPLSNTRLGLNLDWRLDIWRQLRNSRDSAIQRFQGAIERRNYFVSRLVADVAECYYELMALDRRMENLEQTIKLQELSLEIAIAKKDAARGTELAVQRFKAEVRKNQSERLVVRQDTIEAENRINVLLNRYPQPVERASAAFFDLNLQGLNVGLPAELLRNRPDIRQAEREIAAAGLDVRVARANFYPSLTIAAGVGYEAFNPRYLFRPEAIAAGVAGNLVAPLVNKKAIQAEYMTANARQLQSIYDYQRVVVNAFTEVVNRLSMAENYRQSVELKKEQLKALEASVESATNLFQNARAEYIEVLFAQRDLMEARMALIETKRLQLTAIVNAYQALGGGSTLSPPPAIVSPPTLGHALAGHGKGNPGRSR
jgi:multidrug efflux system outer membrane protein